MAQRRKIRIRLRRQVILRAQNRCEYCRAPEAFSLDTFTIDHILPIGEEGRSTFKRRATFPRLPCCHGNGLLLYAPPANEAGGPKEGNDHQGGEAGFALCSAGEGILCIRCSRGGVHAQHGKVQGYNPLTLHGSSTLSQPRGCGVARSLV